MKKIVLEKKHYQWGLTAFLVLVLSVLVLFGLYRIDAVAECFKILNKVLAPILYGLVMAYLLCPIYNFTVSKTYAGLNKGKYKFKYDMTVAKVVGTIISMAILLVIIGGVLWMIIPGLFDSIMKVIAILPSGLDKFSAWVDIKFAKMPFAQKSLDDWSENITSHLIDYATNTILPKSGTLVESISGTLIEAFGMMFDFFIGIIVCVYFLNIKDTLGAQAKKIIIAHFKESRAESILEGASFTNKTFGGFISGKIIDSIIIGIICFIVMSIFGWEYSLLISCIIGITNIIPFFGPFIGAIPSALLLLIVNPMHCLYFIIFIFILQQFDGNILGPKILGDSTGISSFWVLFSVLVGGGLFGFIGMILSIPVFAVLSTYFTRSLNKRLKKKGFSTNTLDYKVDKYRTKKPRQKRKRPYLNETKGNIVFTREDRYDNDKVQEITEEELREAEKAGQKIMETTMVEYGDSEPEAVIRSEKAEDFKKAAEAEEADKAGETGEADKTGETGDAEKTGETGEVIEAEEAGGAGENAEAANEFDVEGSKGKGVKETKK